MRKRPVGQVALVILGGLAGALTVSWTAGQAPPRRLPADLPAIDTPPASAAADPSGIQPASINAPEFKLNAASQRPSPGVAFDRFRNLEGLPDLTRQAVIATLAGMSWLNRYNQENGLFLHGYLPAVNQPMEGDNLLHQSLAAFVLARAARFSGDAQYAAHANQSILALLSGTSIDPLNPGVRRPAQPSIVCNRLACAGYLLMAINELPKPADDLVARGEELANFIRRQQRDDGSLNWADAPEEGAAIDADGANHFPAPALYGLALSQRTRPASWKSESLRRAVSYYRKYFHDHPNPELIPWMTAACTEAYSVTKEKAFVEFAMEMNDWLCGLQYSESPDPRHPYWRGGFRTVTRGKGESAPPGIEASLYAQSLADCCRLIRMMSAADLKRYDKYRLGAIHALQFVATLQFTEGNTGHISAKYQHLLMGGFHPTHINGDLRIDQSAAATSAFIQFLSSGADREQ